MPVLLQRASRTPGPYAAAAAQHDTRLGWHRGRGAFQALHLEAQCTRECGLRGLTHAAQVDDEVIRRDLPRADEAQRRATRLGGTAEGEAADVQRLKIHRQQPSERAG